MTDEPQFKEFRKVCPSGHYTYARIRMRAGQVGPLHCATCAANIPPENITELQPVMHMTKGSLLVDSLHQIYFLCQFPHPFRRALNDARAIADPTFLDRARSTWRMLIAAADQRYSKAHEAQKEKS